MERGTEMEQSEFEASVEDLNCRCDALNESLHAVLETLALFEVLRGRVEALEEHFRRIVHAVDVDRGTQIDLVNAIGVALGPALDTYFKRLSFTASVLELGEEAVAARIAKTLGWVPVEQKL
jgi:hypothetical protein